MLELLEDEHPRPLAEDEAVAVAVERAGWRGSGSSLRVERAVRRLKPVTPNGWIMLCVPPESITSASPRRMISNASPIACELAAQAVRQFAFGPRAPKSAGEVAGGRARLLLGLVDRVELLDAQRG